MSTCTGCDKPAISTLELGGAVLCEECIRRECIREHPPIEERPWLASHAATTKPTTSKDNFAA